MSNLTLLSAAWNILNTWWGFGAVFALGITHGGPVTLIYGMILLSLVYGATALSLAEMSAHYPTAGGQYHWTFLLAPEHLKQPLVSILVASVSHLISPRVTVAQLPTQ